MLYFAIGRLSAGDTVTCFRSLPRTISRACGTEGVGEYYLCNDISAYSRNRSELKRFLGRIALKPGAPQYNGRQVRVRVKVRECIGLRKRIMEFLPPFFTPLT